MFSCQTAFITTDEYGKDIRKKRKAEDVPLIAEEENEQGSQWNKAARWRGDRASLAHPEMAIAHE